MGIGRFLGDIFKRVLSNILVVLITAGIAILLIQYVLKINIIGFFF